MDLTDRLRVSSVTDPRAALVDVLAQPFVPVETTSFGFTDQVRWFRLTIDLPPACIEATDWALQVRPPFTDRIELHWADQQGEFQVLVRGDQVPTEGVRHRVPEFRLDPWAVQFRPIWFLKIAGQNSLAIDVRLLSEQGLASEKQKAMVIASSSLTLIAVLSLLSLVQSLILRQIEYVLFTAFNLSLSLIGMLVYGVTNWWPNPSYGDFWSCVSQALNPLIVSLATMHALQLYQRMPIGSRVYRGLTVACAALGIGAAMAGQMSQVLPVIQGFSFFCLLVALVVSLMLIRQEP